MTKHHNFTTKLIEEKLWNEGRPLRLHLGCGMQYFEGYINIDYPPSEHTVQQNAKVDLYADITKLNYPYNSIDEIRLHHVFEHFDRSKALALLINWVRWLKIDGVLHIETPDVMQSAKQLTSFISYEQKQAVLRHVFGSHESDWAYHYDGWYDEKFANILGKLGFDVSVKNWSWKEEPHLANVEVRAVKTQNLSVKNLIDAADKILRDSLVADVESEFLMLKVWQSKMHDALRESNGKVLKHYEEKSDACAIIFSKNRAMQLEATLNSFYSHCTDSNSVKVKVLFTYSAEEFKQDYDTLKTRFPLVDFVSESEFKNDILKLIQIYEYVLFLVDDNIFVKRFAIAEAIDFLKENYDSIGFSLRLGKNTTYCYPLDRKQSLPLFKDLRNGVLKYKWTDAEYDFGYPLEVSSTIYRKNNILPLLFSFDFVNPNDLESKLNKRKTGFSQILPYIGCFSQSVTFCSPINKIQTIAPNNRAGEKFSYGVKELSELFMSGLMIDFSAFDKFVPGGCHQEVELNFIGHNNEVRPSITVSVIIPCYNYANYLSEAVKSVVDQSYKNFEIIIVNDGSTDNTAQVAEDLIHSYPDYRIKLINQKNSGIPAVSRNNGIKISEGGYFLCLDADDKIAPEFLEKTIEVLNNNKKVGFVYTHIQHFGMFNNLYRLPEFDADTIVYLDNTASIGALVRKSAWEQTGGFNESNGYEDWDFWVSCIEKGWNGYRIPETLFFYRKSETGKLNSDNKQREKYIAQIVLNHPSLYSANRIKNAEMQIVGKNIKSAKILIVCTHFWPSVGGLESISEDLGNNLVKLGYTVDVATLGRSDRLVDKYRGMKIISLDPSGLVQNKLPGWVIELRSLILSGLYQSCILLADPMNQIIWSLLNAEIPKETRVIIQPVINKEGYDQWKNNKEFRNNLSSILKSANVVSLSKDGLDATYFKEESIPSSFIPNAVNNSACENNFRTKYKISSNAVLILHAANLWQVKNHLNILKEFKDKPANWVLVMIGYPSGDKKYVSNVKNEIDKSENVIYIPGLPKDKMSEAMEAADFIILGSKAEGAPVTILEAMSHGKPWISTGSCEAVKQNAGGLITDLVNFKSAVEFILNNPDIRAELATLGKLHWQRTYNWTTVVKAWEEMIISGETIIKFGMDSDIADRMLIVTEKWNNLIKRDAKFICESKEEYMVSVIIPTHNRKEKLGTAIQSVLSQTYPNFEIIVINDGGEKVRNIANGFNDVRIKYFEHETNKGLAAARNTGLKNASGKYVAYLDDDDIFYPDHLEILVKFIEHNNYSVAYTDSYKVTQELRNGSYITVEKSIPFSNDFSKEILLKLNIAPVLCFMHKRSCVDEIGLFDETLKAHEDWDFWIRLSERYDFYHIKKITSEFRQRTDKSNMTSSQSHDFYNSYMAIIAKHYNRSKDNPELLTGQINNLRIIKQRAINAGQMSAETVPVEVSIIIPVYNKMELTQQCLLSLYKNTPHSINYEVIIVDNGSTDGTNRYLKFAQNIFNNLFVITNGENIGFARANNLGVKHAKGKFVLFLNNDTVPLPGWLQKLYEVVENDPEVVAVGSKLIFPDGSLQHAGVIIIEDKQLPDPLVARHIYWKAPADLPEANKLKTYHTLTAACLLVRKNAFDEINGFDEEYWNGYEDVDLCFKLGEKNYKIVYQPESVVIHHESQSGPERFAKVSHNIERLHKKWIGVIKPDFILEKNGEGINTGAGKIKNYISPKNDGENYSKNKKLHIVSIIALSYNQSEYTKKFVGSILRFTKTPFELILIDNGSDKETVDYIKLLGESDEKIKAVLNSTNQGFPKAVNQGLKTAKGNYILIANNDIVVTEGWLERMLEVAESDNKIGIVGPISNAVSGVQLDKETKYSNLEEMYRYSEQVKQLHSGQTLEFPRVAFLCTLIKREVINKIGGLDERFSPGNYEDDDYCLRAQIAGFKTVIAKDVFIHHYSSISFTSEGLDKYKKRLETNLKIFVEKWGGTPEEIWLKGKQIKGRNIMITLNKNEFVENVERALSLIEEKDYQVAIQHLNNAIETYDQFSHEENDLDLTYLMNLAGNISMLDENFDVAKIYFEKALNQDPASSLACSGLGDVLFISGNYEAAKTMYEWGVKNDQGNQAAIEGLAKVNKLFNYPYDTNSLFESMEDKKEIEQLNNESTSETDKLIDDAYELFNEKNFESALNKLTRAEKLFNGQLSNPTDNNFASSFYNMKGFIYLGLDDIDKAKSCFEKALSLDPNSSQACAGLGEILYLTKQDQQAKTMFEWAIKNNPDNLFAAGGLKKVNNLLRFPETHSSLAEFSEKISQQVIKIKHRDDFGILFNNLGLLGKGVEIGVQKGIFSKILRSSWRGKELYLIDRWKYEPDYKDIANVPDAKQKEYYLSVVQKFSEDSSVQILRKDSLTAANQFPDDYFDWIYIDADHSFDGCSEDLKAWYPKLRSGGILAGHDYIDGEYSAGSFGVKSAVDNFIKNKKVKLFITDDAPCRSWYFVKHASEVAEENLQTSGVSNMNSKTGSQKSVSNLNEILTASFDLFGKKNFQEALTKLDNSKDLFYSQNEKKFISAFENLKGLNYLGLNEKEKARESFETALNENPESSQALAGLGELLYLNNNDTDAKIMFEKALNNNPVNLFAAGGLSKVNRLLGLPYDHSELEDNVSDVDSFKFKAALNQILESSFELFGLKYFDEAIENLNKSEELFYSQKNIELISAYENLKGFNYLGLDNKETAKECFESALNINPKSSQACAGLAELFYLEGKDKEAKTMYEYALENNPDNQFALGGLEKVNKILNLSETNSSMAYNN